MFITRTPKRSLISRDLEPNSYDLVNQLACEEQRFKTFEISNIRSRSNAQLFHRGNHAHHAFHCYWRGRGVPGMNYRHAFHAGNHADVLKHAVLARIIHLLKAKDKPFAFLDAHSGIGVYDLESSQALKTGEWRGGILKMAEPFEDAVERVLLPYRQVLAAMNSNGGGRFYPGSPKIALDLLRAGDRVVANELHPEDFAALRDLMGHDKRLRITSLDAMQSVKAELPFNERRGLVLIDPPYEILDETERTVKTLVLGHRRFATGVFVIWYPVTTEAFATHFVTAVQSTGLANMLHIELRVKAAIERGGLAGSGLVIVNPPWGLEADLTSLMPALAARLGLGEWGRSHVKWLTPPT
jgi:23S rRNA (adenine2030-N6)-methyltransferase